MAHIKAPEAINGIHVTLRFVNGESDTENPWLIEWFQQHGYTVTTGDPPVTPGETPDPMLTMTVKELIAYAKEKGIDLGENTKKADILAVIQAAQ